MFAVVERKLVVIVPCFETTLRHPDMSLCITGSSGDSGLIDNRELNDHDERVDDDV